MKTAAARTKAYDEPGRPKIVEAGDLAGLLDSIYHAIAYRAYELYEARGRQDGHDIEDWFHAESELLRPVKVDVRDLGDYLAVHAEVVGFAAKELTLGVEARRVIIWGQKTQAAQGQTPRSIQEQILRSVDLPVEIDPKKTAATLKGGALDITLPKITSSL